VAGRLRLDLAQYRELAAFAQFGSDLDKATQAQLTRGERMVEILKQNQYQPYPLYKQVIIIYVGGAGQLDNLSAEDIRRFEQEFLKYMDERYPQVGVEIQKNKTLTDDLTRQIDEAVNQFKKQWASK
jgi:F-type H+-transporting ATPase subunit alpha